MGLKVTESWTDVPSGLTCEPRVQVGLAAAWGLTENFINNKLRMKRNPEVENENSDKQREPWFKGKEDSLPGVVRINLSLVQRRGWYIRFHLRPTPAELPPKSQ